MCWSCVATLGGQGLEFLTNGIGTVGMAAAGIAGMRPPNVVRDTVDRLRRQEGNAERRVLIRNAIVLSMDPDIGNIDGGDVLVEGRNIRAIGKRLIAEDAIVVDASDMIVIPGLVDTHRHAWQGALRNIVPNADFEQYRDTVHRNLALHYLPDDMRLGNLAIALGCIDGGITCIIDNSHNARSPEHSDGAIQGLLDAGIRAVHANGHPRASNEFDNWLGDFKRLRKTYFSSDDQLLTLRMFSDLTPKNLLFARRNELAVSTEFFDPVLHARQLAKLVQEEFDFPTITFNHCTSSSDDSWRHIRDCGGNVNVCPRSDAQYLISDGIAPLQRAKDFGLRPGISVDNETSYGTSMFAEMSTASILQRTQVAQARFAAGRDVASPISAQEVLSCATVYGAECAGLSDRIGSLTPGKRADLVMIRTTDIGMFPVNNAFGAVVSFATPQQVDTVMIDGEVRKFAGELLDVDFSRLRSDLLKSRDGIFARSGYELDLF